MTDHLAQMLHHRKLHDLMPHRVREVLLVSSPYDAFILQEDGHLTDQVFLEYKSLALSSAPRFTHVTSGEKAIEALENRRFDLVLAMPRLADTDLLAFGRRVKELRPNKPLVILTFDNREVEDLHKLGASPDIDGVFSWNGDARILLAVVKYIEDRENADHDIATADVRVILLVEDSIRYASEFLAALFPQLMRQSQSLFAEGLNPLQKLMHMRTRPKVLHARNYEEAMRLFTKYHDNMLAVITDAGFEWKEQHVKDVGLTLVREIRRLAPSMPILFQTANLELRKAALALDVQFLDKNSPSLLSELDQFLRNNLGFGDFIFRMPDGREIARAADLTELEKCLRTVPIESLEYHGRQNHISNWLMARSEFELAQEIGPKKISDFADIEEVRQYLLGELRVLRRGRRRGAITDLSDEAFDADSLFQRLGGGSMGGKARGLAFLNLLLTAAPHNSRLAGLPVMIPQSFVLATDLFDEFMAHNKLNDFAYSCDDDEKINGRFLRADLPGHLQSKLGHLLEHLDCPLAVRSSSLLEDDMSHPFAGIYRTLMLANNHLFLERRLEQLCQAIKLIYASTFHANAKAYIQNTNHRIEQEKMAIVIERVVGQRYGNRHYPHFAGVAQSYNYYPIGPQTADDGVVQMALGLGRMVVEGGHIHRFSPRHPLIVPAYATPELMVKNSQRRFYSLDLGGIADKPAFGEGGHLQSYDLSAAEEDGVLRLVGSRYNPADNIITETIDDIGPWVVTFNNILKHRTIPLAEALTELLDLAAKGMGCAVEIEFACDLGDFGRRTARGTERREPILYALQMRPIVTLSELATVSTETTAGEELICRSDQAMGHGIYRDLCDLIYVKPESFNPANSKAIARQVGDLNRRLVEEGRSYVLIGPGRWGSSDHWLGIPVNWAEIAGARIIVEASPAGYLVDPSQGTHFFHNITSLRIGYFTIPPGAEKTAGGNGPFVDWAWLERQAIVTETPFLRQIRPAQPLTAWIDGRKGMGLLAVGRTDQAV